MCYCSQDAEDMPVELYKKSCFPLYSNDRAAHCLTCGEVLLGVGLPLQSQQLDQFVWGDTTCRDQSIPSAELLFGEWRPDQS